MTVPGAQNALENARTIEYRTSIDFQLNEMPGKLRPFVGSSGGGSSSKLVEIKQRFDDVEIREKETRHAKTEHTSIDLETRWIAKPRIQYTAPLIDPDDVASTKLDLTSPVSVQTGKNIRRAQDRRWLEGYYGNALVGGDEAALTTVPFKSANIMAVDYSTTSTPTGITLAKLIAMREMMAAALVDLETETPLAVVTAKQVSDLLKINELRNRDYNPMLATALQTGKPGDFMGFRWVPAEIGNPKAYGTATTLTVDGSGYRRVPFFVPSGMHWESWEDFFARVSELPDQHYETQIYARTCGAATRVHEDKCFQMLALEV